MTSTFRIEVLFDVIAHNEADAESFLENALLEAGDAINDARPDNQRGTQIASWGLGDIMERPS